MKEIESLAELKAKAATDPNYDALAVVASRNLGGPDKSLAAALDFLEKLELEKYPEGMIVDEINFVIDLVPEELVRMRSGRIG